MLILPSSGISRSTNKHNIKIHVMCDWIEASVLFDQDLSKMDIIDVLLEEQIYDSQDFAEEAIENCWAEFTRRQHWMKCGYPFQVHSRRISKHDPDWRNHAAYSFCLLLSLAGQYDWWTEEFGRNYNDQGQFFEALVHNSMKSSFSDWTFFQTGWTRSNIVRLNDVVHEVAQRIGDDVSNLPLWDGDNTKEMGLDLLGYRHFNDDRQGNIVYLIQCASGADWKDKLKTPDLEVWKNMISFASRPSKGFAAPFLFDDDTFKRNCIRVDGLLLDRSRIISAHCYREDWLPAEVIRNLVDWSEIRVTRLMERST